MAMTAAERDELHALIEGQLGERGARLLMAGLATADLQAMEERLALRIDLARSELRTDMSGLEAKFAVLEGKFGELRGEVGEFRGEVGQEFGKVRAEMAAQNRLLLFATVTAGVGIVGILVGIAGLIVTAAQLASA